MDGQNFVEHTLSVRSTSAGRPAVSVCSAAAVVPPPSKSTIRTPMAVPPIDPPSNRNRKKKFPQTPSFQSPYSQFTSYFHQSPPHNPNPYPPYAHTYNHYEQAPMEPLPFQHHYPHNPSFSSNQVSMDDTLGIISQEQEEFQTALASFTSAFYEFISRIPLSFTNNQNTFQPPSFNEPSF
ncbi:hypothetical protein Ahy_A06g028672 [Arachis hypogaea]|uniref:Uncharacterized protein n=1 Tax=Arachis hypogaea TaxID=3818 RepID=A0A445CRL2_ARAHY|nr:hypothetical protein Ahy_A06g028672 [Arachis hypogaea]